MKIVPLSGHVRLALAALILPPASLIFLAAFGLLASVGTVYRSSGLAVTSIALALLWLTSSNAVAILISRALLPQVIPLPPESVAQRLADEGMEAIVVLGAGVEVHAPEYGTVQLSYQSASRLKYGAYLSKLSGLPLGFAGGIGWAQTAVQGCTEAAVARIEALAQYGIPLHWADEESRDTHGNAVQMAGHLLRDRVRSIVLVTHAWHMPRAVVAFEGVGLVVLPAPMGFIVSQERRFLEWFPSTHGLMSSRYVFREWLALKMAALR